MKRQWRFDLLQPQKLLRLFLLLSVVLRVGLALYFGDHIVEHPGIQDEITYDALALSLVAGRGYQFDRGWYPFTEAHSPTAHWSFVYPLYLAIVYGIVGHHPLVARVIQAVLSGLLLPWFAYSLGRRLFGLSAGIAAAGLIACYGYFIYHNAALMTDTFFIVGVLWAFDLAYTFIESGDDRQWWLLGIVMGGAVLLRQTYLFFVPLLLFWMAVAGGGRLSRVRLVMAGVLALVMIAPWTIRNAKLYNSFLLLNSNSGYALYTANHPAHGNSWQPDYIAPIPGELAQMNEAELDRELLRRGLAFIWADPVRFLRLTLSRVFYHFRFWPTPDSALSSIVVRMMSFGLYLPFIVSGMVMSWKAWRRCLPLFLFGFVLVILHVASWPGPRYRFPVDAVGILFAGLPVASICDKVYSRWKVFVSRNAARD